MLKQITADVLECIENPVFKENAQHYLNIQANFLEQIQSFGLSLLAGQDATEELILSPDAPEIQALQQQGVTLGNDCKSLHSGWLSPSCLSCRTGTGTATYTISTQCPRNCFFCFNPNQENYVRLQHEKEDPRSELMKLKTQEMKLSDIALTGGEPLVHKEETIAFFKTAQELYPQAYTRLYTSGAYLDEPCVLELAQAGVDEIRFSLKTDDTPAQLEKTYDRLRLARKHLARVVVEMPVMPDELEVMKELLLMLDEIGIDGINLLELCFPFNNAEEFKKRGYALKHRQFRVLYNYWYAGGLPIANSETVCIKLLEFAQEEQLQLGVHYCSLENKLSGQIYQQNHAAQEDYAYCSFSERDYFLKSAKVYGEDAEKVAKLLTREQGKRATKYFRLDKQAQVCEFPPHFLALLKASYPDLQVALSYHVVEHDGQGQLLRELRLDLTTPKDFCEETDV